MQYIQSFIDSNFSFNWWRPARKTTAHQLDQTILNAGLGIAVSASGCWLLPVQSQLSELYPELGLQELDQYNEVCQDIIKTGITLASQPEHQSRYRGILPASRTQTQAWKNFDQGMRHHYPWISESNLHSIFSFARSGTGALSKPYTPDSRLQAA